MIEIKMSSDYGKLELYLKNQQKECRPVVASILNSLATQTIANDKDNLIRGQIVRNSQFLKNSLVVRNARLGSIESMVAIAASLKFDNTTGFESQQTGETRKIEKKHAPTLAARKGNIRNTVTQKARFKKTNTFYKPQQFPGKSYQQKFYVMMRILGSRGGGMFLLDNNIATHRGHLGRGLYQLSKAHQIIRMAKIGNVRQPKHFPWRTLSLQSLQHKNNIASIWQAYLNKSVNKYK